MQELWVQKAGVVLYGIADNSGVQGSLFDDVDRASTQN